MRDDDPANYDPDEVITITGDPESVAPDAPREQDAVRACRLIVAAYDQPGLLVDKDYALQQARDAIAGKAVDPHTTAKAELQRLERALEEANSQKAQLEAMLEAQQHPLRLLERRVAAMRCYLDPEGAALPDTDTPY